MAVKILKLQVFGGLNKDDTSMAAKPYWVDAQWVRFISVGPEKPSFPESIGGWVATSSTTYTDVTRAMHAWVDKDSTDRLALGATNSLRTYSGGAFSDITPPKFQGFIRVPTTGSVITTNGSSAVTIINSVYDPDANTTTLANHDVVIGDSVTLSGLPATVGGLALNGTFRVVSLVSPTSYRITGPGNATSTALAVNAYLTLTNPAPAFWRGNLRKNSGGTVFSVTNGSPTVTVTNSVFDPYTVTDAVVPHGLSVGDIVTFGGVTNPLAGLNLNGTFTVASIISTTQYTFTASGNANATTQTLGPIGASYQNPGSTLWSLDNWGGDLVGVRRGGPLFYWQPAASYANVALGTAAGGAGWTVGTGVAVAGVASNFSYSLSNKTEAGKVYRLTMTMTRSAGSLTVGINAGSPVPAIVNISPAFIEAGTWSFIFQMPPAAVDLVFQKDSTYAGTLTPASITLGLENMAFRIDEAPTQSGGMFVDANQIAVLFDTVQADGVRNPLCIRTSDRQNIRTWIPDTDNLATENILAKGGRIIAGIASRQSNLIFTDTSVFSMSFTGQASGAAFDYKLIGSGFGLIGPKAVAEFNGFAYWMSTNGQFYATSFDFQGTVPKPIPCPIRSDIFDNLVTAQQEKTWAWVNTKFNEIWWFYVDTRYGQTEINAYAFFSIETGLWSSGALDSTMIRTAGISAGIFDYPILAGLITSGTVTKLYDHERGVSADGGVLTSSVRSSEFEVSDGDTMVGITRIAPDVKGQTGNMTVEVFGKGFQRDDMSSTGALTITPTTVELPIEFLARSLSFKFSAAATSSAWRMGAPSIELNKTGARR